MADMSTAKLVVASASGGEQNRNPIPGAEGAGWQPMPFDGQQPSPRGRLRAASQTGSLARTISVTSGAATELSSIFNLSNTILGSGTLAMPYACHQCGAAVFLLLLAVVGLMATDSLQMLITAMENNDRGAAAGPMSYGRLAKEVHSVTAEKVACWAVIVQSLGACVAYIVIIADVLQPIAGLG